MYSIATQILKLDRDPVNLISISAYRSVYKEGLDSRDVQRRVTIMYEMAVERLIGDIFRLRQNAEQGGFISNYL